MIKMIKILTIISIILIIIFIFLIVFLINKDKEIDENDKKYFETFKKGNKFFSKLINNNILEEPKTVKNKFLFLSFDNRTNISYITKHNENVNNYVKQYGYEYKFLTKCFYNVYWCKILLVLEELKTNKYDYVVWLDTDTAIQNINIDINDIVNKFDSDIFVGNDNTLTTDTINSGIFIIKNSANGINFLQDCINNVKKKCFKQNNTLFGKWAGYCYEQGQMNLMIAMKYSKNTTVLPNNILFSYHICSNDTFIMHFYNTKNKNRDSCFE